MHLAGGRGFIMDRAYFVRQIRTLLKLAKSTSDPHFAAVLVDKAAQLQSHVEEVPAAAADASPLAPDVELESPLQRDHRRGEPPRIG
jgi:hypothetical protein